MARTSAGLLLYRRRGVVVDVLLVHPGGPFWRGKDLRAWSIPKGEVEPGEDPLATAVRELEEETGVRVSGPFLPLGSARQKGGKTVQAWAAEGEAEPEALRSGTVRIEIPRGSGRLLEFPEVDRAGWFPLGRARELVHAGQEALLDALAAALGSPGGPAPPAP